MGLPESLWSVTIVLYDKKFQVVLVPDHLTAKKEKEPGAHLFPSAVRSHSLFCVMLTVLGVESTEVEKQIESLPIVDMVLSV